MYFFLEIWVAGFLRIVFWWRSGGDLDAVERWRTGEKFLKMCAKCVQNVLRFNFNYGIIIKSKAARMRGGWLAICGGGVKLN